MEKVGDIAPFTLITQNPLSADVLRIANVLSPELVHRELWCGQFEILEDIPGWLAVVRKLGLRPVPVFDRKPRHGCPNEHVKRVFHFTHRAGDPGHCFPGWVPQDIAYGVKIYPRCRGPHYPLACARQIITAFPTWQPPLPLLPRRRPEPMNFPGDRPPYMGAR